MSPLIEVTYYQAGCDACGTNLTEDDEYSAWAQAFAALERVQDSEGLAVRLPNPSPGVDMGHLVLCRGCLMAYEKEQLNHDEEAVERLRDGADEDEVMRAFTWAKIKLVAREEPR